MSRILYAACRQLYDCCDDSDNDCKSSQSSVSSAKLALQSVISQVKVRDLGYAETVTLGCMILPECPPSLCLLSPSSYLPLSVFPPLPSSFTSIQSFGLLPSEAEAVSDVVEELEAELKHIQTLSSHN